MHSDWGCAEEVEGTSHRHLPKCHGIQRRTSYPGRAARNDVAADTRLPRQSGWAILLHPRLSWVPRGACHARTSGLQMQREQNIVGNQATPCQHLYREEVRSCEHVHMGCNELLPSHVLASLGC